MTFERWIVQEWNPAYEAFYVWGKCGSDYRFWSYHNARNHYEEYKKEFHYTPCIYRYCKIEIQPETIINTAVHSTIDLNDKEINLTQTVEPETMKFA